MNNKTDVHTEHCCVHHCKYGYTEEDDKKCSVVSGRLKQSFKCSQIEFCGKLTEEELKAAYAKGVQRDYSEDEVKLLVNSSCEAVKNEYERRAEKMRYALKLAMGTIENASNLLGPNFNVLPTLNAIDRALKD